MKSERTRALLFALAVLIGGMHCNAASLPFVHSMFGDHKLLQHGKTNTIRGWTAPGAELRMEIAGQSVTAIAHGAGRWQRDERPGIRSRRREEADHFNPEFGIRSSEWSLRLLKSSAPVQGLRI